MTQIYWSLFLRAQLTFNYHDGLVPSCITSHYLKHIWPMSMTLYAIGHNVLRFLWTAVKWYVILYVNTYMSFWKYTLCHLQLPQHIIGSNERFNPSTQISHRCAWRYPLHRDPPSYHRQTDYWLQSLDDYLLAIDHSQSVFALIERLTWIPAWISDYRVWDETEYPFPIINGAIIEVWERISNVISHSTGHVITYQWFG